MILSIFCIGIVALVTYFHFLQGFFSGVVSAVCATTAVLVAFGYYEPVVDAIKPGSFADSDHGMMLMLLFAVTYIVLRVIIDTIASGNVMLPSTFDKIGGAVMGVIVGLIVSGLVAVAAQALPFGPSIMGYSRYTIQADQPTAVNTSERQMSDRHVYDQMTDPSISVKEDGSPEQHESLLLPVDDWIIGFINHASNGGSTAGDQAFSHIHPDYPQELFGQRIGIELGGKRTAPPVAGKDAANVLGVFTVASLPQADAEFPQVTVHSGTPKVYKPLTADNAHAILIVRVQLHADASDSDHLVRFSMGSVRLRVPTSDGGFTNVYPVGTVDNGSQLLLSRADDFLFMQQDNAADFCFYVESSLLPDLKQLPAKIPADADLFVEVKRFARTSLAGMEISALKASPQVAVLRKKVVMDKIANADPNVLRKRLVGVWSTSVEGQPATITYTGDGRWTEELTVAGQAQHATGNWTVNSAGADGLSITRSSGPVKIAYKITFVDENNGSEIEGTKAPVAMQRK